MGCECKDKPIADACNCIVYSGGPMRHFYKLVGELIPDDAELSHSHPIVHDDGSLEFTGETTQVVRIQASGTTTPPRLARLYATDAHG